MAGSSAVYTSCRPHAHGGRHRLLLPANQQQPRGLLPWRTRARGGARARASLVATAPARSPTEEAVYEVVLRQAALVEELQGQRATRTRERRRWREEEEDAELGWVLLGDAYERCGEVCAEYAKTFCLGCKKDCAAKALKSLEGRINGRVLKTLGLSHDFEKSLCRGVLL